ncbi:unnamed protein product, partial [Gordionus sp. m RMFG-2023]
MNTIFDPKYPIDYNHVNSINILGDYDSNSFYPRLGNCMMTWNSMSNNSQRHGNIGQHHCSVVPSKGFNYNDSLAIYYNYYRNYFKKHLINSNNNTNSNIHIRHYDSISKSSEEINSYQPSSFEGRFIRTNNKKINLSTAQPTKPQLKELTWVCNHKGNVQNFGNNVNNKDNTVSLQTTQKIVKEKRKYKIKSKLSNKVMYNPKSVVVSNNNGNNANGIKTEKITNEKRDKPKFYIESLLGINISNNQPCAIPTPPMLSPHPLARSNSREITKSSNIKQINPDIDINKVNFKMLLPADKLTQYEFSMDDNDNSASSFSSIDKNKFSSTMNLMRSKIIIQDKSHNCSYKIKKGAKELGQNSEKMSFKTKCKSQNKHLCIFCGKYYSRRYGLKIHLRTHTGYKPLRCKYCERSFGDPSNLNKHIRLHNNIN